MVPLVLRNTQVSRDAACACLHPHTCMPRAAPRAVLHACMQSDLPLPLAPASTGTHNHLVTSLTSSLQIFMLLCTGWLHQLVGGAEGAAGADASS